MTMNTANTVTANKFMVWFDPTNCYNNDVWFDPTNCYSNDVTGTANLPEYTSSLLVLSGVRVA